MTYIHRHPPQVRSPTQNQVRATSPSFSLGAPPPPTPVTSLVSNVVGRLMSHTNGAAPITDYSCLALECPLPGKLECPLPGKLDIPSHFAQLRGRHRHDHPLHPVQHDPYIKRQHLTAIPPYTRAQVIFANASTHEGPDPNRHETCLAKTRQVLISTPLSSRALSTWFDSSFIPSLQPAISASYPTSVPQTA